MARPVFWLRGSEAFVSGAAALNLHKLYVVTLTAGQTLTRVRFRWQASKSVGVAASERIGVPLCFGIILVDAGTPVGSVPSPFASPDADWLYFEHEFMRPYRVQNPDGTTFELDIAPSDPSERDGQAQRLAVTDQDMYVCAAMDPSIFPDPIFYFSIGGSILIRDAA